MSDAPAEQPGPAAPPPAAMKRCAGCDTLRPLADFRQGNKPTADLKTCAGCRARVAERRRERKEEERGELRARALDLAQSLLFLADSHPEYRAELSGLARRLQRRGGGGRHDRGVEAVSVAMGRRGCHSVSDIADETGMAPSDVLRVLSAMRAAGRAEPRPVRRGETTQELWFMVGGGRAESDVLP